MLPEWWLQFDQRFLTSRPAAFAGRLGRANPLTSFLSTLEGRVSEMLARSAWLERFVERGAAHAGGYDPAYDRIASTADFQWLTLEDELDDLSEEAAYEWLERVAPTHPVVRQLRQVARRQQRGVEGRAEAPRGATGRRPASSVGARRGAAARPSPAAAGPTRRPGVVPGPGGAEQAPAAAGARGLPSGVQPGDERGAPVVEVGVGPVRAPSIPSVPFEEVERLAGAAPVREVLRSLLGLADRDATVHAGVTPRALLRALAEVRRSQAAEAGGPAAAPGSRFEAHGAERVWVQGPGEAVEADRDGFATPTSPSARRLAPADARFAETLSMSPGLRALSGLVAQAARGRAVARPEPATAASPVASRAPAPTAPKDPTAPTAPTGASARRMPGSTALRFARSSPLLRALFEPGARRTTSAPYDVVLLQSGAQRLAPASRVGAAAERFAPVSFGAEPRAFASSDRATADPRGWHEIEREWVVGGEEAADAEVADGAARAPSPRRGRRLEAGAVPARSARPEPSVAGADGRPEGRAVRGDSRSPARAEAAFVPALVTTLRRSLEARSLVSPNVLAFERLSEALGGDEPTAAMPVAVDASATASEHAAVSAPKGAPKAPRGGQPPRRGQALPIGFAARMRAPAVAVDDGGRGASSPLGARPAGAVGSAVRLSGLALDANGAPVLGRSTAARQVLPLSESLTLLARAAAVDDGPQEGGAVEARPAGVRAIAAVRAAIAAYERRVTGSQFSSGAPGEPVAVTVPAPATPSSPTLSGPARSAAPATRRDVVPVSPARVIGGEAVAAPDGESWAGFEALARQASGEDSSPEAVRAFVAAIATRLAVAEASPAALRAAVDAAWSASREVRGAASRSARPSDVVGVGLSGATRGVAGPSRALAFGDRVLSFVMPGVPAVGEPTGGGAPARGYADLAAAEPAFVRATDEGARPEADDLPAARDASARANLGSARVLLAEALRASLEGSPSRLPPAELRRAARLQEQLASGKALSAAEVTKAVAVLGAVGVVVPAAVRATLRASSGALPAAAGGVSAPLARAEAWRGLAAVRATTEASAPQGQGARAAGVRSALGPAGTEALRHPAAERLASPQVRVGGNLSRWLQPTPALSKVGRGGALRVVPALAARTLELAGWSTGLSASGQGSAPAAGARALPQAEIGEWVHLEGADAPESGAGPEAPTARARGRRASSTAGWVGALGAAATISGGPRPSTKAPWPSTKAPWPEGAALPGGALAALGPNLSRWLQASVAQRVPGAGRGSERAALADVGEWIALSPEGDAGVTTALGATGERSRARGGAAASEGARQPARRGAAPDAGAAGPALSLPMAERVEQAVRAIGGASLFSVAWGDDQAPRHDVGRLGGSVLDLVVLAGEAGAEGPVEGQAQGVRGARPVQRRGRPASAGATPEGAAAGSRGAGREGPTAFVPLDGGRVAGLQARVGGWLRSVYGGASMSGALSRGRALEGFASLLLGGGTAAEASQAFSLLEGGAPLTFLDFVGEGAEPPLFAEGPKAPALRAGTLQPAGRRPDAGGVGAVVGPGPRAAIGAPGGTPPEAYAAQAGERGAFVETAASFRQDASAFFAQTAEPGAAAGGSSFGTAGVGGLGLPLVSPVVNVVSQAASFSLQGTPRAGGAGVREEVTTSVERISKGREDSEKELRKVLPELVEMLRRRMRTERERRGLV